MGVAPRAADGVELATRPSFAFIAIPVVGAVYLVLSLAIFVQQFVAEDEVLWSTLIPAVVLAVLFPVMARAGWSALASDRAAKASLAPGVGRAPVSVEPVFFPSTRLTRPKFRLRIRSAEGHVLGTVRSGHLRSGVDPTRFTVLVGGRTYGGEVALETVDGRVRLLPGSPLAPEVTGDAPWSRRATDLLGWTAPGDPALLVRASEARADRLQLVRVAAAISLVLVVLLRSSVGQAAFVGLVALMVIVPVAAQQRGRRALVPEIRRVAPDVGPELHSLVAQLVLRDPGAPFPTVPAPPLPPPPTSASTPAPPSSTGN